MAGAEKAKKQSVNFDLPLSDSVQGKSTVDGLTVAMAMENEMPSASWAKRATDAMVIKT